MKPFVRWVFKFLFLLGIQLILKIWFCRVSYLSNWFSPGRLIHSLNFFGRLTNSSKLLLKLKYCNFGGRFFFEILNYSISLNKRPSSSSNFQISAPKNFPPEKEIGRDVLIYFELPYYSLQQFWQQIHTCCSFFILKLNNSKSLFFCRCSLRINVILFL